MDAFLEPTNAELTTIKQYLHSNNNIQEQQISQLVKYTKTLLTENDKHNLIGKNTQSQIWSRHVLDSIQLVKYLPSLSDDFDIIDLGSGAGFPAIILAIATGKKIVMIEKSPVKSQFLTKICTELNLTYQIINQSINNQNIVNYLTKNCVITSRAFKSINEIFELLKSEPAYNNIAKILLLKGSQWKKEIQNTKPIFLQKWKHKVYQSILGEGIVIDFTKSDIIK